MNFPRKLVNIYLGRSVGLQFEPTGSYAEI